METVTSMIKWKLKDVMDERGIKSKIWLRRWANSEFDNKS